MSPKYRKMTSTISATRNALKSDTVEILNKISDTIIVRHWTPSNTNK
jgi:hypothetical protein